jgi:carbon monoxide dehydrogenase subunit G
MASVRKEVLIDVQPDDVWAAIRDYGAVHRRLVPGFLTDCRIEGDARIVTFHDGRIARELLVDIDEEERRLVYAEPGGRFVTRSASVQVFSEGGNRSRLVWINDFLPNEFADLIRANMDKAVVVMKQTLEASARQ